MTADNTQPNEADIALSGAQETLLITLLAKYNDFYEPRPVLADRWAVETMELIPKSQRDRVRARIPNSLLGHPSIVSLRARLMDDWTTDFLTRHKDVPVTVVHLACGLDSRALRLRAKCGVDVRWVDLDLPPVIEARRVVKLPSPEGAVGEQKYTYEVVASDVLEEKWLENISADRPTLVVMEGLSMYLTPENCEALFRRLVDRFALHGGEIVVDGMSPTANKILNWYASSGKTFDVHFGFTVRDPKDITELHGKLELLESHYLMRNPYTHLLPTRPRMLLWLMSWVPYVGTFFPFMRFKMDS